MTAITPEPVIEQWLDNHGVVFKAPRNIPIADINEKASRNNQARPETLDFEVVERYTAAMKNGDVFPALVVYKSVKSYIIVDGNHRHAAYKKAGISHVKAYEIDKTTPSETIELLLASANTKHGAPTSNAWRARQALYLTSLGHDEEVVAKKLSVTVGSIKSARAEASANQRASRLNVPGWDGLSQSTRNALNRIHSDVVFREANRVVTETGLGSGAGMNDMLRRIKQARDEALAIHEVRNIYTDRMEAIRTAKATGRSQKSRVVNPKQRMVLALGHIMAVNPREMCRVLLTDDERSEMTRRIQEAGAKLMECDAEIRKSLDA